MACKIRRRDVWHETDFVSFGLYCNDDRDDILDGEIAISPLGRDAVREAIEKILPSVGEHTPLWEVDNLWVADEHVRQGHATKLYEAAAQFICKDQGHLVSTSRTRGAFSTNFWEKQHRKGRALRLPGVGREARSTGASRVEQDAFVLRQSCMSDLSEFSLPKRWPLYAAGVAALLLLLAKGKQEPRSIREEYRKYGPVLDAAAARHGLSAALLRAVAYVESRWNPNAGSGRGAVGLLQLMPGTATSLGVTDRTDPVQNANGGAKFLASLYQKAGSWPVALAAYNWGPGNVFGSSTKTPHMYPSQWPASTQQYVREILDAEQGGVA